MIVRLYNFNRRTSKELEVTAQSMGELHDRLVCAARRTRAPITVTAGVDEYSVEVWTRHCTDLLLRYTLAEPQRRNGEWYAAPRSLGI
jgi:hypothetical protein